VITCMKALIIATKKLGNEFQHIHNYANASIIEKADSDWEYCFDPVGKAAASLWEDAAIQRTFQNCNQFQLYDCAEYYFRELNRLMLIDYVPTNEDILRSRVKTTGIVERRIALCEHCGLNMKVVDVGGTKNERKKWVHCFLPGFNAVIFCVALSDYDLRLYEDESKNRMTDSLALFEELANSKWCETTSIIILFTKLDIFKQKIQKYNNLHEFFPDYISGDDVERAAQFICSKYIILDRVKGRQILPFFVNALDTTMVAEVFSEIKDIVFRNIRVGVLASLLTNNYDLNGNIIKSDKTEDINIQNNNNSNSRLNSFSSNSFTIKKS